MRKREREREREKASDGWIVSRRSEKGYRDRGIHDDDVSRQNAEKGQKRERKMRDKEREREKVQRDIAASLKNDLTDNEIHFPRSIKGKRSNLDFATLLRLD